MSARLILGVACFTVSQVLCHAPLPGTVQFRDRYIGHPFSDCVFTKTDKQTMKAVCGDGSFFVSENEGAALEAAQFVGNLQHTGSPYLGYIGHEADVFKGADSASLALHLNSYELWVATRTASEGELYNFGNRISYFGPSIAVYMLMFAAVLICWPLICLGWIKASAALNARLDIPRVIRREDRN